MTDRPIDLSGKYALVTGAARRVGKAIALALADAGMHLIIHHGNSDAAAAETADEVRARGVQAFVHKADLRQGEEVRRLFAEIASATHGLLHVVVNNAANFKRLDIMETTPADWEEVLSVNLTAPLLCSQTAAPLITASGGGSIINIIDLSAFAPWRAFGAHSVSKAALKSLTEVLALSLGPHIRVNAIAPGPVLRDEGNSPQQWEAIGARLPLRRTGNPADIGRAVAFLASQPFITGATLRVDGGESI
jgi:pteridine reductase